MAFSVNGLKRLVPGAEGASIWLYVTNDTQAAVDSYFDVAAFTNLVKAGDFLFVSWDVDGTPVGELMHVTSSSAGAVTMGAVDVAGT